MTIANDDLDAILAAGPRPKRPAGNECATGWALGQLDEATAEKFRTAIDYNAEPEAIADAFEARGYGFATRTSVARHQAGRCQRCAEKAS